jgi:hypothetical protein
LMQLIKGPLAAADNGNSDHDALRDELTQLSERLKILIS